MEELSSQPFSSNVTPLSLLQSLTSAALQCSTELSARHWSTVMLVRVGPRLSEPIGALPRCSHEPPPTTILCHGTGLVDFTVHFIANDHA